MCWRNTKIWFILRWRGMWSWMNVLRNCNRKTRTSKPEWTNMLLCQGSVPQARVHKRDALEFLELFFTRSTCLASNIWVFPSGLYSVRPVATTIFEVSVFACGIGNSTKSLLAVLWHFNCFDTVCAFFAARIVFSHCSKALCWDTFSFIMCSNRD